MKILPRASYREMPWKNGAGTTTEIAVHPRGAAAGEFLWRVSMAPVAADGWFSEFPGIERSLAVLQGAGISLAQKGAPPVRLGVATPAHCFAADVPTYASLSDGPILDLNVMTRRGHFTHRLQRRKIISNLQQNFSAETTLLFCPAAALLLTQGQENMLLPAMDTAVLAREPLRLTAPAPAWFYLIEINPD